MNPQTLSPTKRRLIHVCFFGLTGLGVLATGLVAYRAGRTERAHLKLSGDISASFPGIIDAWSQQPEWLPIGYPAKLNVNLTGVGDGPAINSSHAGRVYIEPDFSLSSSHDAISKFDAWLKLQPPLAKETIAKGESKWATFSGDAVTPEDYRNIANGTRLPYEVGTFWFDDDVGSHYHNFCYLLQPPQKGGLVIFASCREHTNEGDMPGRFMRLFQ